MYAVYSNASNNSFSTILNYKQILNNNKCGEKNLIKYNILLPYILSAKRNRRSRAVKDTLERGKQSPYYRYKKIMSLSTTLDTISLFSSARTLHRLKLCFQELAKRSLHSTSGSSSAQHTKGARIRNISIFRNNIMAPFSSHNYCAPEFTCHGD